tara:strand:- start:218 stop:556 length:339 start_codon:yes stop_codon:yes gene_type:complete
MKFIVAILILTVSLGSISEFSGEFFGGSTEISQAAGELSIVKASHDCPEQNGTSHGKSGPCNNFCHHSGHCHFIFPIDESMNIDVSNRNVGNGYSRLIPDPHPDGLFRPPII